MPAAYPGWLVGSSPGCIPAALLLLLPCALAEAPTAAAEPGTGTGTALAPYTVTDAARIGHSLTGEAGDAAAGAALYADAARTGCAACHEAGAAPALAPPDLPRDPGVLRLWLVAPELRDPALAFHGQYRVGQRSDPRDPLHGGPRLTPGEIEDLVAWLAARAAGAPGR